MSGITYKPLHVHTDDGWLELLYSEYKHIFHNFSTLDLFYSGEQIQYIEMPGVKIAAIRHLLAIHINKYSVIFDIEEVEDVKDTARMLMFSSNLVTRQYLSSDPGMLRDIQIITYQQHLDLFNRNESVDLYNEEEKDSDKFEDKEDLKDRNEIFETQLMVTAEEPPSVLVKRKKNKSHRKNTKGEAMKAKQRRLAKMTMKDMVMAAPDRARLFDRSCGKEDELKEYPGLIWDGIKTKFNICINCCEVMLSIPALRKHQCRIKSDILQQKSIEVIETRTKYHNLYYLRQYYTEVSVDKIKCNECGCELQKLSEMKEHVKKVHNILSSNHMCPECGSMHASSSGIRQHLVDKHGKSGLAKFPCPICERNFVTNCLLSRHHQLTHSKEKPHICDVCAKGFKRKAHLEKHTQIHTGEKNFTCQHCPQAFRTIWTRTQHERRHLGIRPYNCTKCGQSFGQKNSLDSHYKVHHSQSIF